jgi:hypothetical protein
MAGTSGGRLLRGLCLGLHVVELARRRILLDNSRTHGPIRLFNDDPDSAQVRAHARGFLGRGVGLVKIFSHETGEVAADVASGPSSIKGYSPWSLLCPLCHRQCRRLLIPPPRAGGLGCTRCLHVKYPDRRRQRSWPSTLWLGATRPALVTDNPRERERLRAWAVAEIRRLGLTRGRRYL